MAVRELARELVIPERRERSPWADAFQQLLRNRMAVASGIFIIFIVLTAVLANIIAPYSFDETHLKDNYALPGDKYLLGADALGRDVLSRTIYGARVSLSVAVVAATISLIVGIVYGLVSGYFGGRIDEIMMRIVDFVYGVPILIFVILMQVYFKALSRRGGSAGLVGLLISADRALGGLFFVFIAMGLLNWIGMARITRGQVLPYKEKEFIIAAHSVGVGNLGIIFRHLLPNVLGPCIVQETLAIPGYIFLEAFLSYIGLGVNPPTPSWGIMIQEGFQALRSNPHVIFTPSVALTLTVLAFNFLGDGLRDAFDPMMRGTS
ncbi:MAG: ABC transporter permease [Anaerolineae bacterium]